MEKRFTVDNQGLGECQAFIASLCDSPRPQIIMDEIVSNIVRCSGATFFSVTFTENNGEATLVFVDDGREFDPTAVASPDLTAPAAERAIGGLGILMVKKMSKSVAYSRRDHLNVLSVVMAI